MRSSKPLQALSDKLNVPLALQILLLAHLQNLMLDLLGQSTPYLVPVNLNSSWITHKSGVSGSELTLWDVPLMFSDIAMLYPSYSCANVSSYLLGSPEAQATPSPRFIFAICAMSASSMEKEKMSKFWRIRS